MRIGLVLMGLALLTGCKETEQTDEQAIAAVNAAQDVKPPVQPIAPQPILYPDITNNKLHGKGCAFVADGGGIGAILIAQNERAFIKLEDKIVALASDAGSAKMPLGSWSRYTGKEYALVVKADEAEPKSDASSFKGGLVITDAFERPVYQARGIFQCREI